MTTLYDMGTVKDTLREAIKVSHPNLNADDPAPLRIEDVVRAKAILSDPELRAVYDRMLEFERQQHQQSSVVRDAIVVVVLAIVMAGAYTLYSNLGELSAYLPKISIAKVATDAAREPSAVVAQPSPLVEGNISDRAGDKPESANIPPVALSSAATPEAVHAAVNVAAQSSPAADANASARRLVWRKRLRIIVFFSRMGRFKFESAEASAPSAVAQTNINVVAMGNATHEPAGAALSPLANANTSDIPRDRDKDAVTSAQSALAPAANGGDATGKATSPPSAVTPSTTGTAVKKNSSSGSSGSAPIKDATFYRDQGIESYRDGDLPVAIANFDRAIQLDRNFEEAYIDRAIALYRLRKFDSAFADVAQAIRIQNSPPAAAAPPPKAHSN
jgi:tetratricopeptide (TPR) repeat protein